MVSIRAAALGFSLSLVTMSALFAESTTKDSWHQWRGPNNNGVAEGDAPLHFSDTQNVKWKIKIPGKGNSTPVIWGDTIFVTTAVPTEPIPEAAAPGRRGRPGGPGGPPGGARGPGGGGFDFNRFLERLPEEHRKKAKELLKGRGPWELSEEEREQFGQIMREAFGRGGPGGRRGGRGGFGGPWPGW